MKAARMYGVNDIRVEECAIPQIGPDEILLKVKAAAICGTDLRMIQNGDKRIDREHPRILVIKRGCMSALHPIWDAGYVISVCPATRIYVMTIRPLALISTEDLRSICGFRQKRQHREI